MKVLHVVPGLESAQGGIRTAVAGTLRAMTGAGLGAEVACVGEPEPPLGDVCVRAFAPTAPRLTRASAPLKRWLAEHADGYDAVVAHTIWLSPTRYAVDAARAAGVPVWLAPHGMLDPDALAHHAWRKRLRWLGGEGRRVRACTLVFSTVEDARRARRTAAVAALPHVVIPNPVDPAWRPAPVPARAVPRVVCLNRLHPRKGVLELCRALHVLRRRGVKFEAVAAGPAQDPAYAARVAREAAGVLTLRPALGPEDARALVQSADVLVHPATGYENFGMVIAEAASAGVCVLASPRALLAPEMAAAGALLCSEPEPGALAAALGELLADPARRAAVAARGLAYSRRFAPAAVASAWRDALGSARKV
ncbi:MAG: glycosyltransferase [Planctomycetes bacterium]|nr:glycosyltransferase [Planctomycetota bacterium]